jgi:divalent metal cation (Fe/Co/Zn/Cd) transporter
MADFVQLGSQPTSSSTACITSNRTTAVIWLQGITLAWMLVECGVSLYAAAMAHSPAILAFGSDSLVELLSATVVLLQCFPRFRISQVRANRAAGALLFALAGVVGVIAILALALHRNPETSALGIGITLAALLAMPALAWLKHREAIRSKNPALAADAVQSATCAYLAGVTLAGLTVNAFFHLAMVDSVAALIALPLLVKEGRNAWRGDNCACC